jgi:hypothetical protein
MALTDRVFEIRQEFDKRAALYVRQCYLPVSYYRIRKRLAVPLPVNVGISTENSVRAFSSSYPWAIWLTWALEERIVVLGESVSLSGDAVAQTAVEADLLALASWSTYREARGPDLSYAHAVRILWVALTQWAWVDEALKSFLHVALRRAVEDALPLSDEMYGAFETAQTLLRTKNPREKLHNIPLIGTCALALAAKTVGHPAADKLDGRVAMLFTAVLELRQKGFTEGVSYDGYVLCFVADWLSTLDVVGRDQWFEHPSFTGLIDQTLALAAPGNVMATAPLGDVEPVDMPFVWSALAKLQVWRPNPRVTWVLSECDVSKLRADALVALLRMADSVADDPSVQSPVILNYALVLRTGYATDDLAVAMGLSMSQMGHIHCDNGSLVLGSRGRWWLDDPGYQQYLQTAERRFTVGPTAHNAPVINGHAQVHKQPELLEATRLADAPDVQFALIDLTACYAAEVGVHRVRRAVWLIGDAHLVVCDEIAAAGPLSVAYYWHGHPDLYWCIQGGAATMVSPVDPDRSLQLFSPQIQLGPADLARLPGSRGQQTLSVTIFSASQTAVWWVLSFSPERPVFRLVGRELTVGNRTLRVDERLPIQADDLQQSYRQPPLLVTAIQEGNLVKGQCVADIKHFDGELEYAFYLMVGGEKAIVQWYTTSPQVCFTVPDDAGHQPLAVCGFVRESANPDKKLMEVAKVAGGLRNG